MFDVDTFWIANALYLGFVIAGMLSGITKPVAYRRGSSEVVAVAERPAPEPGAERCEVFTLERAAEALTRFESGVVRGKLVFTV